MDRDMERTTCLPGVEFPSPERGIRRDVQPFFLENGEHHSRYAGLGKMVIEFRSEVKIILPKFSYHHRSSHVVV